MKTSRISEGILEHALSALTAWENEMSSALAQGNLKVLTENSSVKWMQTPKKLENAGKLLEAANTMVLNYTFGKKTFNEYKSAMTSSTWTSVLNEINANKK